MLEVYKLILFIACVFLLLLSTVLYSILYQLDQLRYGEDLQILDHCMILGKIAISLVFISQLWLYHGESALDYGIFYFFGGIIALCICLRGSFSAVNSKQMTMLYVARLSILLFMAAACMAIFYYSLDKIKQQETNSSLFKRLFVIYSGAGIMSGLVALALGSQEVPREELSQQQRDDNNSKRTELLPVSDQATG